MWGDPEYGNLVYEPLMQRSRDEPFSMYGLIAEKIETDTERTWAEFTLNPNAHWSDGKHITPEDVIFTFELGIAILAESSLSFLGVGIQPPTPSWGLMIAEGKQAMFYRPWLVVLPGICLFLLVIGANLMGDGLRDITSPEGRNE